MKEIRNIKVDIETWKKLHQKKINEGYKTVGDIIEELVNNNESQESEEEDGEQ